MKRINEDERWMKDIDQQEWYVIHRYCMIIWKSKTIIRSIVLKLNVQKNILIIENHYCLTMMQSQFIHGWDVSNEWQQIMSSVFVYLDDLSLNIFDGWTSCLYLTRNRRFGRHRWRQQKIPRKSIEIDVKWKEKRNTWIPFKKTVNQWYSLKMMEFHHNLIFLIFGLFLN